MICLSLRCFIIAICFFTFICIYVLYTGLLSDHIYCCFVSGYKFVISGSLDRTSCGSEMIQPFSLLSNTSSKCVTRKSQCNGEGQVVYSDGTTTDDRSCSCNYIDNFAFVTRPKSKCFCIPSQEDCSCYYKPCPVGNFLTPGNYLNRKCEHKTQPWLYDITCQFTKTNICIYLIIFLTENANLYISLYTDGIRFLIIMSNRLSNLDLKL